MMCFWLATCTLKCYQKCYTEASGSFWLKVDGSESEVAHFLGTYQLLMRTLYQQ